MPVDLGNEMRLGSKGIKPTGSDSRGLGMKKLKKITGINKIFYLVGISQISSDFIINDWKGVERVGFLGFRNGEQK